MNTHVLFAVFKRNFVSYFANPTGYVFICVFVLLSSAATFWPTDFFNNNLANLDQLSYYFPLIMLMFVPSITMGIWADERRQGTDELLLTIPAGDSDIVLGKFLAGLAIYTVALLFSLLCNFLVLRWLGRPDVGLFIGTYVGYWLIGMAMLAIGMVASFLTGNLTISYIFGAIFNAPLVMAGWSEALLPPTAAAIVKRVSVGGQLSDFSHGVVSLAGVVYFVAIAAMMLYLCMVLISRRHWLSGARGAPMVAHYFVRVVALAVIAVGASVIVGRAASARIDATAEGINSLSKETLELLDKMEFKKPVQIEAFISPDVPESYVQTRLNLLSTLREFEARGKGMIRVLIHDTTPLSDESALAQKKYGIEAKKVYVKEKGIVNLKKLYMNVVVSSGLQQVPPIFVDRGVPIEYELIRSLGTVTDQQKKRIGVLATDAQVMGGRMSMMNPQASPNWQIISELEKQYEVVSVEPSKLVADEKDYVKAAFDFEPTDEEKMISKGMELLNFKTEDRKKLTPKQIEDCKAKVFDEAKKQLKFDVILAVQPSSLTPEDMQHFLAAVKVGQPMAIFEDPLPRFFMPQVPGTSMPKQAPGGMQAMMMGMRAPPKGDIKPLWDLLGVDFSADEIVFQDYNPYPKSQLFPNEFVFVDQAEFSAQGARGDSAATKKSTDTSTLLPDEVAFNPKSEITAGLQQVLFPYPGWIAKRNSSDVEFVPLARTGHRSGVKRVSDMMDMGPMGPTGFKENAPGTPTGIAYVLASEISGNAAAKDAKGDKPAEGDATNKDEKNNVKKAAADEKGIHVVLVGDIDLMSDAFFRLREAGADNPEMDINFNFDNVTFILNILDEMAGDRRYIEIRKHRPKYRTLERIDQETEDARSKASKAREQDDEELKKGIEKVRTDFEKRINEIRETKNVDRNELAQRVQMAMISGQQELDRTIEDLQRKHDVKIEKVDRDREKNIESVQRFYKFAALLLPPIFPLFVALGVFVYRRGREREGVARSRLR
jgi:ABC-2 type transport system permease protein